MTCLNLAPNIFAHKKYVLGNANLAATALTLSELSETFSGLLLVITPNSQTTEQLLCYLSFFASSKKLHIDHFPDWETLPYDRFAPHQDIVSQRLRILRYLPTYTRGILLVPITTLLHRLPPKHYINKHCFTVKKNDLFNIQTQCELLASVGYQAVDTVYNHGEFAVRGSIMDLYPMGSQWPVRIDLLDQTVDGLRLFHPDNQKTLEHISHIEILTAREYPLAPESCQHFTRAFSETFDVKVQQCPLYIDIKNQRTSPGAEYYLPLFFDTLATLFDYLPEHGAIVSIGQLHDVAENFLSNVYDRYENYRVDNTHPLLHPRQILLTVDQFFHHCNRYKQITIMESVLAEKSNHYNIPTTPLPDLQFNLRNTTECKKFLHFTKHVKRILLVVESAGHREKMIALLKQACLFPVIVDHWQHFLDQPHLTLALAIAPLNQGLWCPSLSIAIITENQLLGIKTAPYSHKKNNENKYIAVNNLNEFHMGDPVVHLNHGIGRYQGLKTLEMSEQKQEFITLSYADSQLYIPVEHMHLISCYNGFDSASAPLHKLGNNQWEKAKRKASEKIHDIAAELLDIYARRDRANAAPLSWSEKDYLAFANEFPFETTHDQQTAIDAVLQDLQQTRPMDRLICGDVGFGKTEVAMRATFVTLCQNYQVVILVPTTLLAQQHYNTFCDRFASWPFKIEVLSRFKTLQQTKIIKNEMTLGTIDIIIGTHKLLTNDIKFKNLGLLVIDEEHRFGVRQKERIKSLRSHANILTLTATPIPRTLNMAMNHVRDLSIIATPPAKRLSIKTFLYEKNDRIIKEAISRELLRGGQVYYLYNDIKTIEGVTHSLKELVPEARIAVGHGQMRERQLEKIMHDFYHKYTNVLVCTTIIETGIDIPNANTIIIHRADKFGLAQLHQLRGRVGRSHHQAYAYLMIPPQNLLSPDAIKRLQAIENTTDLGSGFIIATHDLEIRGAGNLLGDEQSGQIASIGFTLYTEMLNQAVTALKGGATPQYHQTLKQGVEINLQIPVLIPESYVASPNTRLIFYRRIAACTTKKDLKALQIEFLDRFGMLPETVQHLFQCTLIKLQATRLGIDKIEFIKPKIKVCFSHDTTITPEALISLIQKAPNDYHLQNATTLHYTLPQKINTEQRLLAVEHLLEQFY